jgi:hypothetical protein
LLKKADETGGISIGRPMRGIRLAPGVRQYRAWVARQTIVVRWSSEDTAIRDQETEADNQADQYVKPESWP